MLLTEWLRKHVKSHTKPYQCKICLFRAAEEAYVKKHLRSHVPETKRQVYVCTRCHKRLKSKKENYERHVKKCLLR